MTVFRFDTMKSIEQLEGMIWDDVNPQTSLIEKVLQYRKVPVSRLSVEQLRLLIGQNIGLPYLIPQAVEELKTNILAEGDLYEGDLLSAVLSVEDNFWKQYPSLKQEVVNLLAKKQSEVEVQNEENSYRQLLKKMEAYKAQ